MFSVCLLVRIHPSNSCYQPHAARQKWVSSGHRLRQPILFPKENQPDAKRLGPPSLRRIPRRQSNQKLRASSICKRRTGVFLQVPSKRYIPELLPRKPSVLKPLGQFENQDLRHEKRHTIRVSHKVDFPRLPSFRNSNSFLFVLPWLEFS